MYLKDLVHLESMTLSIAYGLGGTTSLRKNNDTLWTGECDACMDMMYNMDDFLDEWKDQKTRIQRLPALKAVKWQFRHKNQPDVAVDLYGDPATEESDKDVGVPNGSDPDD